MNARGRTGDLFDDVRERAPTPEPLEKVQLRRTVQAIIDVMSEAELARLNLPASAIVRLFRR